MALITISITELVPAINIIAGVGLLVLNLGLILMCISWYKLNGEVVSFFNILGIIFANIISIPIILDLLFNIQLITWTV